jgi:predicted permease
MPAAYERHAPYNERLRQRGRGGCGCTHLSLARPFLIPEVAVNERLWSWARLEQLAQDLRIGTRILTHARGVSATAILLIALVVGGNTTIYSMVNSMLTSPAPGITRTDLVVVQHDDAAITISDPFISFPNFEDYQRAAQTVVDLTAWSSERLTLTIQAGNFALNGALTAPNFFATFGIPMLHGRGFEPADDEGREGLVAVISERLWDERFKRDRQVIGQAIIVNRTPATVVGVAAEGFAGANLTPREEIWLPIRAYYRAIASEDVLSNRGRPLVLVAGRLANGASYADANAEFVTLSAQLQASYPSDFTTYGPRGLVRMNSARATVSRYSGVSMLPIADMAPLFLAIFSVVTLLTLAIVCANVANLLMARAVERQRDTAVRHSLGASQGRILRMVLAEGITLSLIAAAAAALVAWWTSRALLRVIEPVPGLLAEARPDWTTAAYALGLALLATVAFSAAPAIRTWRVDVLPLLKAGEHNATRGRSRLTSGLVVLQCAVSVLLVTSAALAYRTMSARNSGNLGFAVENLLLVTVRVGPARAFISATPTREEQQAAFAALERVRNHLSKTTGVESATYAVRIPAPTFLAVTPIRREGAQGVAPAYVRRVGPDYLRTLGLTAAAGRDIHSSDDRGATRVAVISHRLAADLFPTGIVIGQPLFVGEREERVEVVGIAPDALYDGPTHDPYPRYLFVAEQQMPAPPLDASFIIRHRGTVDAFTPIATRAVADADPSLPIVAMATMRARMASVTQLETMIMRLLLGFAAVSLLVASIGQYAVAMFNMRQRTRDFGVRLALGASARQIQTSVIRESFALTVPGLLIGLSLSVVLALSFQNLLFSVSPIDPPTYAAVFLILGATSLVASYLPARRASRVSVVEALRTE